jgi:hypothetical protein|nr:MAG TPA: Protein of unknown function (DUF3277) [Caudoviricetes sp.]DAW22747.1 MAG TPA: Protein of unknown function (DUF3277) [Caudoviricetes sp.]
MADAIKTYNPKEVVVACGTHIVSGYADDSFINIEPNGDGITKKVGCDGEIARSISPDNTYKVKITLLQNSDSNSFFSNIADYDRATGNGLFPVLIKDLRGGLLFATEAAWVIKKSPATRGKETNNREWEIDTASAVMTE